MEKHQSSRVGRGESTEMGPWWSGPVDKSEETQPWLRWKKSPLPGPGGLFLERGWGSTWAKAWTWLEDLEQVTGGPGRLASVGEVTGRHRERRAFSKSLGDSGSSGGRCLKGGGGRWAETVTDDHSWQVFSTVSVSGIRKLINWIFSRFQWGRYYYYFADEGTET